MEVRDPIHGNIDIDPVEALIIEHPLFQRLRSIKQLGLSEYAFPGATHTRYLHSIGVMHVASLAFETLFKNEQLPPLEKQRLKETLKLAALLHDCGHAPLSHATECVMPLKSTLKIPPCFTTEKNIMEKNLRATHEDYTLKIILDSSLTSTFSQAHATYGVEYSAVASLIKGMKTQDSDYFRIGSTDYFPLLHQLVSSELDCDRMDYLLRDSYFCGVSYGKYDLDWMMGNIEIAKDAGMASLALNERAIPAFDDFLLSRYHMFLMVYFHYRAVCLEQMMYRYFASADNEYFFPNSIEEYAKHDDHFLIKTFRHSQNTWANQILHNQIPEKLVEIFGTRQSQQFDAVLQLLKEHNLDHIVCESQGRLSKYYANEDQPAYPLKIKSQQQNYSCEYIDLQQATNMFHLYSQEHSVRRIHMVDNLPSPLRQKIRAIFA
jgi:HD superfamily phosphohydrolase